MDTKHLTAQEAIMARVCSLGFLTALATDQAPRLIDADEAMNLYQAGLPVFRLQAVEQGSDITGDVNDDN